MRTESRRPCVIAITLISLFVAGIPTASAQIVVTQSVLAGGGAIHTGSEVVILSTVGQPLAGAGPIASGFWSTAASRFVPTAILEDPGDLPVELGIADVFPNPFREHATIRLTLPEPSLVHVSVHDVMGRQIAVLMDGPSPPGTHELVYQPPRLASGTYLFRLKAGDRIVTRAATCLR